MAVNCGSYGDTILDIVRNLVPTRENNYGLFDPLQHEIAWEPADSCSELKQSPIEGSVNWER
jgi:hypothetical protein